MLLIRMQSQFSGIKNILLISSLIISNVETWTYCIWKPCCLIETALLCQIRIQFIFSEQRKIVPSVPIQNQSWYPGNYILISLTLSRRRSMSYRNQSIDLQRKSMDWLLNDRDFRHERVFSEYSFMQNRNMVTNIQVLLYTYFYQNFWDVIRRMFFNIIYLFTPSKYW